MASNQSHKGDVANEDDTESAQSSCQDQSDQSFLLQIQSQSHGGLVIEIHNVERSTAAKGH